MFLVKYIIITKQELLQIGELLHLWLVYLE